MLSFPPKDINLDDLKKKKKKGVQASGYVQTRVQGLKAIQKFNYF